MQERKREKKAKKRTPRSQRSALFTVKVEKSLIKGINKTVKYLKKTAKSLPKGSAQRLELQDRILNLYMENATYTQNMEERNYEKAWNAWEARGQKGKEPKLSNKKSKKLWKKVIIQADVILKEYPKNKKADKITYNKAIALQYLGKETRAAQMYTQLIQKYPNSSIAGDAFASLGDFYFDKSDFRNAKTNYTNATKYKKSSRFLWSHYKLGWCLYNIGTYRQSLNQWKKTVRLAKRRGKDGATILDETLKNMVFAFAEIGNIESAISYYKANGGRSYIGPFLTLLAQILSDQGKYKQSVRVLKRYQQEAPTDAGGPDAQKEIVSLYYALAKYKLVWKELERFPKLYGRKSRWARANQKDVVLEAQSLIKDQIFYYASLTHQRAIKDDNRRLNIEAKKGYILYLQYYPKSKETVAIKYYIADIDYYLKNYKEAGRYYMEIGKLGKKKALKYNPQTKKNTNVHKEVSIYMVNAFVKDFGPEFKALKKRKPNFKKPKKLSSSAKNYLKSCALYTKWYPKDKKRVKSCEVGAADVYFFSGYKKKAVVQLKKVAMTYPNSKQGKGSIELLIPLIKDDKKELALVTTQLLKVPQYRKGKIGKKLRALQRGSEKEVIAKEKDTLKRAKAYELQAKKYPNDPDVDKLWYNAAVDYLKAGAIKPALAAYLVIVKKYPKADQAKDSLLQVALINEKIFSFGKASKYYQLFAKKYPKDKQVAGVLSNACKLEIALNTSRALQTCLIFAKRYPDGAQGFIESLIVGAERAKRYSEMAKIIKKYYLPSFKLSQNEQIVAHYRIYKASGGKGSLGQKAARSIEGIYGSKPDGVSGEALRYVGSLAYKRVAGQVAKFAAVKLKGGTVDNLLKSIQAKALALSNLEQAMATVSNTSDSYYGVAALYQVANAYYQYAEALSNPPKIEGASKEDVVKELSGQIQAQRQESLKLFKLAMQTVSKFKVYNEWSVKVVNGLAKVKGQNFEFDDYVVTPDFIGSDLSSSLVSKVQKRN